MSLKFEVQTPYFLYYMIRKRKNCFVLVLHPKSLTKNRRHIGAGDYCKMKK